MRGACTKPGCSDPFYAKGMCRRCYMREYMAKYNRTEEHKAKMREYSTSPHGRALGRKRYWSNREEKLKTARNTRLQRVLAIHGVSIETYEAMLERQNGKCKICGEVPKGYRKHLCIDHCHSTGRVRGLLCHTCNAGIGFFRDDVTRLKAAIRYLKG